jgi:bacteriocin-like protein
MAGKLTIKLTEDQQKLIKDATGKAITELSIDASAISELTDKDLDQVAGGAYEACDKRV